MKILNVLWVLLCCVSLLRADEKTAAKRVLQVGAAVSNITPPLGEMIVGGWTPIPATHIHDELFARCLVIDDGEQQIAIVLCDNVGIPREVFDAAREHLSDLPRLPPSHILMAATHTHSATTARGPSKVIWQDTLTDYQKFLARRIADGVRCAQNNLEPAEMGRGSVDVPSEVFNRRWHVTDPSMRSNPFGGVDQVRMNPPRGNPALVKPAGPIDPEVSFVTFRSVDGRPLALLANYSLHYVGGVRSGDVSADYFGYFARQIEVALGARDQDVPFVAMMSNGTSGDINNIDFRNRTPAKKERYQKMQEVAQKVTDAVYEIHKTVRYTRSASVRADFQELRLKVRKPTAEMSQYLAGVAEKSESDPAAHRREKIYAERIAKLIDAPESIAVPLQVLQVGDLAISAIPFETFVEIGLELKDESVFEDTFTIELANGSYGYLPTPEQHALGGYETWLGTNYVEERASRMITDTLLKMHQRLQD